jgi:excinuclease ABC subunit C
MVASMVVLEDGKPKKSEYKRFKIENLEGQDDYAAMRQVVLRRFSHLKAGDKGFDKAPDLLLIDGGIAHANVAVSVLNDLELHIRTLGMVKDDRHRTRALVTPNGLEIRIDSQQSVFALIGNIQEETHRFAISYHKKLRSKRLRGSVLDGIAGIGPKRKEDLLKGFRSISAIAEADVAELERYLPKKTALEVYLHFHPDTQ